MDYGGNIVAANAPAAISNPHAAYFNKSTFEVDDYEP